MLIADCLQIRGTFGYCLHSELWQTSRRGWKFNQTWTITVARFTQLSGITIKQWKTRRANSFVSIASCRNSNIDFCIMAIILLQWWCIRFRVEPALLDSRRSKNMSIDWLNCYHHQKNTLFPRHMLFLFLELSRCAYQLIPFQSVPSISNIRCVTLGYRTKFEFVFFVSFCVRNEFARFRHELSVVNFDSLCQLFGVRSIVHVLHTVAHSHSHPNYYCAEKLHNTQQKPVAVLFLAHRIALDKILH